MRKVAIQIEKKKVRRKGVHAKSKTSKLKSSKNMIAVMKQHILPEHPQENKIIKI